MAGVSERSTDLAGPVGGVGQHLQAGRLAVEQPDAGGAVTGVGGVSAVAVMSPVSGSTATWAL